MRATVLECKDGKAVVLTEEGQFCNVQGSYEVGQVIDYKQWQPVSAKRKFVRHAAAAVCAVMLLGMGTVAVMEPAAAVTVSIGDGYPVQYLLDKEGSVIRVEATDEDGEELAKQLTEDGVKGKDINSAIDMTEKITGSSYDASKEPPKVEGRNEKAKAEIEDEIMDRHSAPDRNTVNPAEISAQNGERAAANDVPAYVGGSKEECAESGDMTGDRKAEYAESGDMTGDRKTEYAEPGDMTGSRKAEYAEPGDLTDGRSNAENGGDGNAEYGGQGGQGEPESGMPADRDMQGSPGEGGADTGTAPDGGGGFRG